MKQIFCDSLLPKNHVFTAGAGLIVTSYFDMTEKNVTGIEIFEYHTGVGTIKIELFAGPTKDGPWIEATAADVAAAAAASTVNAYLVTLTHFGPFFKTVLTASVETITAANAWMASRC
jgi:hypothetical protein